MNQPRRRMLGLESVVAVFLFVCLFNQPHWAQPPFFGSTNQFDLSAPVRLEEAGSEAKVHLEQAREFQANQQWDDAVETLRQVMEVDGGKVIAVSPTRYITVREFCHLQLSSLPPEALDLYRNRVDPALEAVYRDGIKRQDKEKLLRIVRRYFCSSFGDDALLALGDMALEAGDPGGARGYWERILPPSHWSKVTPRSSLANGTTAWLVYPDTNLELADVRARLVLALILENDLERASYELETFGSEYGSAEGLLGGRKVVYAAALTNLLKEVSTTRETIREEWPTFAGSPTRTHATRENPVVGSAPIWRAELPATPRADVSYPPRRVAEGRDEILSYHPIVTEGLVCLHDAQQVWAFRLDSGAPPWGNTPIIYQDFEQGASRRSSQRSILGTNRFTMTAFEGRLYLRMGSGITSTQQDGTPDASAGHLICLDLKHEGRLEWKIVPEVHWAFEGAPVCDGTFVYVGLRRSENAAQPQSFVGCYDARTGEQVWKRFICSAETPAQGQIDEKTNNLVTLHEGKLYYNTNLGAVARLNASDGEIDWIFLYPRAKRGDLNRRENHFYRDLTPCIYDKGIVFVAPSDSQQILAIDAPTGLLVWPSDLVEDAIHLLGVRGNNLIASGDKIWWIHATSGKVLQAGWPEGPTPRGFGRGIMAGNDVLWPTRDEIYAFDQKTGTRTGDPILLRPRGAGGGNLIVHGKYLLIATNKDLICFGPPPLPSEPSTPPQAATTPAANPAEDKDK